MAVQPTRGLDVGAIEYIHKQIVAAARRGQGVLLVSLELDEVMNLSDRILVMYEGEIVGEFDPKTTTVQELGLYMAGAKTKEECGKPWQTKQAFRQRGRCCKPGCKRSGAAVHRAGPAGLGFILRAAAD